MKFFMKKAGVFSISISLITLVISTHLQAKTLVYCSEGSPEGFNPQLFASGTTYDASSIPLYNRLVEFKLGTTEIKPALAERWQVSDDGKVYTFYLRKGVKWHTSKTSNQAANSMLMMSFILLCGKKMQLIPIIKFLVAAMNILLVWIWIKSSIR